MQTHPRTTTAVLLTERGIKRGRSMRERKSERLMERERGGGR